MVAVDFPLIEHNISKLRTEIIVIQANVGKIIGYQLISYHVKVSNFCLFGKDR